MQKITYQDCFDAIICLNANLPSREIILAFGDIPILAADGAAIQLMDMEIAPNYIIGDLDSFLNCEYRNNYPSELLIHRPDQEANDFEKNIEFAIANGWTNILILGIHGGQLEHTLNNWSVFAKFSRELNLLIYDLDRYGFVIGEGEYTLDSYTGEMISLIPQPRAEVLIKNFEWPLTNEILELGKREGARNISTSDKVFIRIIEGELLVFTEARIPKMVKKIETCF